jgi:hypothetical protein
MTDAKPSYDVAVEEGGLNWEQAGPLFDRYAVALQGRIDRRWVECYQRVTVNLPSVSRFRLEAAGGSVTFTCRSTDGPVEVMAVLGRLEALLERVNREATADGAARPTEGDVAGQTAVTAQGKPATGAATGLLARLTRH